MESLLNPTVLIAMALVAILAFLASRYMSHQAPGKVATALKEDEFKLAAKAIRAMSSTADEDAQIAAAQASKALKQAQLNHLLSTLAPAVQPSAPTDLPPAAQ